jgi:nitrogen fixation protein NifU and related proteins
MPTMYSEKVMEHFRNPRNVGEMEKPDGTGHVGNPVCGDVIYGIEKVRT